MPGLDPGIHVFAAKKAWMAGSSPAMTWRGSCEYRLHNVRPIFTVSEASLVAYGVIDTGEKSTNQLFGCTKPLIFGLSARGPTSWAT
jgi:hypothetical protein